MHRIDTSTAQVDKFGAGKNGFTGGNPQTGELPTALDEKFFDSIQEEIAGVIEGAGITLDKTTNAQLLAALKVLFPLGAAGKLGVATNAQMAAGTSTTLIPTVAAVMSLFSKRSFGSKDYIRIPDVAGGLIIQWGQIGISSGNSIAVGFATNFPTACVMAIACNLGSSAPIAFPAVGAMNTAYFNLYAAKSTGTAAESGTSWNWIALGY